MRLRLIGVPSAWGTQELGARRTPELLREAGLASWLNESGLHVTDVGDIDVPAQTEKDLPPDPQQMAGELMHLAEVSAMASAVRDAVTDALDADELPLIVGGECCVSIGVVPALARCHGNVSVAWLDGHGDLNTPESSESGLITGMPLAVVLGHGHPDLVAVGDGTERPKPEATWLIGGRDLDRGELQNRRAWSVQHVPAESIADYGAQGLARRILDGTGESTLYLHFDVDSIDPEFAPGVHNRVAGGFHPGEAGDLCGYLCAGGRLGAISIASANLDHDQDGRTVTTIRSVLDSIANVLI